MTTRVGFLRAVNVGKRTVSMARLAEIVTDLGFADVWTYINSGNVVFDGTGTRPDLERKVGAALEAAFGFEVTTFVRSAADLRKVVAAEPFPMSDGDTYFVTFLRDALTGADAAALESLSNDFDTLVVAGRDVHWRMRGKSTDTRIPNKEWARVIGKNASTSRNMNMLRKLVEKIDART